MYCTVQYILGVVAASSYSDFVIPGMGSRPQYRLNPRGRDTGRRRQKRLTIQRSMRVATTACEAVLNASWKRVVVSSGLYAARHHCQTRMRRPLLNLAQREQRQEEAGMHFESLLNHEEQGTVL